VAAPIQPHLYEAEPGETTCKHCHLPVGNRVHTVQRQRTRVVVTLDHEESVTHDDIAKALTETWAPYRDVTLYDLRILP
jgi:hypothetical protein